MENDLGSYYILYYNKQEHTCKCLHATGEGMDIETFFDCVTVLTVIVMHGVLAKYCTTDKFQ